IEVAFGEALIATFLPYAVPAIAAAAVTYGAYQLADYVAAQMNEQRMQRGDLDLDEEENKKKKHSPDQQALSDLVKQSGKKGVTNIDADTLLEWANEYEFPARDDRDIIPPHWVGGNHIHIGPKHVPVIN
ncbi:MAG: hypothetical protein ACH350_10375, partial [Parachlamydiaceae bacterium]